MALTVHYELKKRNCRSRDAAFATVAALRERALNLPFDHVGEIVELSGDECNPDSHPSSGDLFLLALCGRAPDPKLHTLPVRACHVVAFSTVPGPGSDPACFGLARYPQTITLEKGRYRGVARKTSLKGWLWMDFCKTQYAANPEYGGLGNFLRCHLTVVQMLDAARELGLLREVCDESGFWEHRDVNRLIYLMGGWRASLEKILSLYGAEPDRLYLERDPDGGLSYIGIRRGSC